jgi:DMSO reductase anchor subunit
VRESSLVAFTLASQAAAGAYAVLAGAQLAAGGAAAPLDRCALAGLSLLMLLGLAASLLHLGTPRGAYRALCGLRSSWLSREVLAALLFAGGLLAQTGAAFLCGPGHTLAAPQPLVALAGLGLVYCMARAYRLRTVAAWDTPAVLLSFLATTLVLGSLAAPLLAPGARAHGPALAWLLTLSALADIATGLWRLRPARRLQKYGQIRAPARPHAGLAAAHAGLLTLAVAWAAWALTAGGPPPLPALALVVMAEVAGRVQFYRV